MRTELEKHLYACLQLTSPTDGKTQIQNITGRDAEREAGERRVNQNSMFEEILLNL